MAKKPRSQKTHADLLRLVLLGPVCAGVMTCDARGQLPGRILLAKWGRNVARGLGPDGADAEFFVNETTAASLPGNQERRGYDTVTLDFDHESHKGHPNYRPGPITTAGVGTVEVVEGKGIYFLATSYTPDGVKFAPSYPDVSGVFWTDATGAVTMVSSVALTRHGAVAGAEFKEAIAASILAANAGLGELPDLLTLGRDLLGFDEAASDADVRKGFAALLRQRRAQTEPEVETETEVEEKPEIQTEISSVPNGTPNNKPNEGTLSMTDIEKLTKGLDELTRVVGTLVQGQTTVAASVAALQARNDTEAHNSAVESIIAASVAAGKVVPASLKTKDDKGRYVTDLAVVKDVMETIPATVQVQHSRFVAAGVSGGDDATGGEVELICSLMDITPEDMKKRGMLATAFAPPSRLTVA